MTVISDGSPTLLVVWRVGGHARGRVVNTGGAVAAKLGELAKVAALRVVSEAIREYDPDSAQEAGEIVSAPRDEAWDTDLLDELESLGSHELAEKDDFDRAPFCWALVYEDGDEYTIYVRKHTPVALARSQLLTRLVDDTLNKVEEPILSFDDRFDLIVTNKTILILDQKHFEMMFKGSEIVSAKSTEWAAATLEYLPNTADSAGVLAEAIRTNTVIRRKIQSIIRRDYLSSITTETLAARLAAHGLPADEYMPNGELDFKPATIQNLLYLLNEDLYEGDFSEQPYAASYKTRLNA